MTNVHHIFPDLIPLGQVPLCALHLPILAFYPHLHIVTSYLLFYDFPQTAHERRDCVVFLFIYNYVPSPQLSITLHTVSAQ